MKRSALRTRSPRRAEVERRDAKWRKAVKNHWGGSVFFLESALGQLRRAGPGRLSDVVHCHHLYAKKTNPHLRHVVENGIPLQAAAHDWVHANPKAGLEACLAQLTEEDRATLEAARLKPPTGGLRMEE